MTRTPTQRADTGRNYREVLEQFRPEDVSDLIMILYYFYHITFLVTNCYVYDVAGSLDALWHGHPPRAVQCFDLSRDYQVHRCG